MDETVYGEDEEEAPVPASTVSALDAKHIIGNYIFLSQKHAMSTLKERHERKLLKIFWEKEEMLVTGIFPSFHPCVLSFPKRCCLVEAPFLTLFFSQDMLMEDSGLTVI